jgi:hypothetical protein
MLIFEANQGINDAIQLSLPLQKIRLQLIFPGGSLKFFKLNGAIEAFPELFLGPGIQGEPGLEIAIVLNLLLFVELLRGSQPFLICAGKRSNSLVKNDFAQKLWQQPITPQSGKDVCRRDDLFTNLQQNDLSLRV